MERTRIVPAVWRMAVALISILVLPYFARAETVEVVSSGVGMTPDAATKGALRSAVEMVVGQLVDAETLVANEEIVTDKILTYCGGYVEGFEPIKEPVQGSDSLFSTKIKARVKKTELVEKLRAENVTKAEVSGTSLFAQMTTKQQQAEDAGAILADDFKEIPVKFLTVSVATKPDGTPDLILDERTHEIGVNIVLQVDTAAYENWMKGLLPKLNVIADAKYEALLGDDGNSITATLPKLYFEGQYAQWDEFSDINLCFEVDRAPDCKSAIWQIYRIKGPKAKAIEKTITKSIYQQIAIEVRMVNAMGRLIGGNTRLETVNASTSYIYYRSPLNRFICFAPSVALATQENSAYDKFIKNIFHDPRRDWTWTSRGACGEIMQYNMKLGTFTPEQIKSAASIKCTISGRETDE